MTPGLEALPWRGPARPPGRPAPAARATAADARRRDHPQALAVPRRLLRRVHACAPRGSRSGRRCRPFWAIYDRQADHLLEQTVNPWPGARSEVWSEDGEGAGITFAHNGGSVVRIEAEHPEAGAVRCFPRTGSSVWVEAVCPNSRVPTSGPASGSCRLPATSGSETGASVEAMASRTSRPATTPAHGLELVRGRRAPDGRPVGRLEPGGGRERPARALRARDLGGRRATRAGARLVRWTRRRDVRRRIALDFAAEAERVATEDRRLVRIAYRQPFGTFTGALAGGLRLERGLGVVDAGRALVVLTRRIRSPRASATVALRREEVDVVAPGERLQRHQPGWVVSKSGSSRARRRARRPRCSGLLPAERRAIEPVVQDHGAVLAPAVVDCEERVTRRLDAVSSGPSPGSAARATTVAEIHGREAPTATGSGASARATPPSNARRPRSAGRASRARQPGRAAGLPGDGGSQLACLAARRPQPARRRPRRPAPRSAAPGRRARRSRRRCARGGIRPR